MNRRSLVVLISIAAVALGAAAFLIATSGESEKQPAALPMGTTVDPPTSNTDQTPETASSTAPEITTTATTSPPVTVGQAGAICDPYQSITVAGTVASPGIVEASGMAASRTQPGVLWAHNDSRDGARVYAIGPDGADRGAYDVAGAFAFDWEDMAAGPGADGTSSSLFFGDIGDNFAIRDGRITVYRVREPDPATLEGPIAGAVALEFEYPDGVFNAEALFVADGSIYVVTKDREEARVYRGDATGDGSSVETLEYVTSLDLGDEVSGADSSWDGSIIALRGYQTVWLWHRPAGSSVADALAEEPCEAPSPDEIQGESIAFLADRSYATISEGSNVDLFVVPFVE
jgi:hypothetical protein